MARNVVRVMEAFVTIVYGLCRLLLVQGCLPDTDDVASIVQASPVVLEGRVQNFQPSAFHPGDPGLFDAVFSVSTVFKGRLDRSVDGDSYQLIVVGPFGTSGVERGCVGAPPAVGEGFILFLNDSGDISPEVGLRHFRLVARPRVADPDSRRIAQENDCQPHCTTSARRNSHAVLCADDGYCLNGGTCYVMPTLGLRFCKCTPEFQDVRCQEKQTMIGEKKMHEENPVKEFFFLIVIGSMATLLALLAICILLIFLIRSQTTKRKSLPSGLRGQYCPISPDPENMPHTSEYSPMTERLEIPATQSTVAVQTDSIIPGSNDVEGYHSNGGGSVPTNGATPGYQATNDARFSRSRQLRGIRDSGPVPRRTGQLPVPRVPSQNSNVLLVSYRGRDLPTNRNQVANNDSLEGVWIARPSAGDVATMRGERSGGLNVTFNPMDSEIESTDV